MVQAVGVVRSPYATPGQVVEVDENDPAVAHYLAGGVLAILHEGADQPEEPVEGSQTDAEVQAIAEQPRDASGKFVATETGSPDVLIEPGEPEQV